MVVCVLFGDLVPLPPLNLNFTRCVPHFYLIITSLNGVASISPLLCEESSNMVWKPRFTEPSVLRPNPAGQRTHQMHNHRHQAKERPICAALTCG